MDEDIEIINTNTRSEKIKNFFIDNKKILLSIIVVIILSLLIFFGYSEFKKNQKIKLSNLYNSIIIEYDDTKKIKSAENLIEIVNKKLNDVVKKYTNSLVKKIKKVSKNGKDEKAIKVINQIFLNE